LWNGSNGEFIACLGDGHVEFIFSRDGSRLACFTKKVHSLTLWNGDSGYFIGAAKDVGDVGDVEKLAISDDGSFLAAASSDTVALWGRAGRNPLSHIDSIEIRGRIALAFSRDLLAMASYIDYTVKLYDLRSHTIISTLRLPVPTSLAISPDSTRLAAGCHGGDVRLWDIASIKAPSNPASKKQSNRVWALAFSPDRPRLAAGFHDGTVELWNTDQAGQTIASHKLHSNSVTSLAFSSDGEQLASGSWDKTVRVWEGRDGSTSTVIQYTFPGWLRSVAFSSHLLAAATKGDITIWDRKTLCLVDTINLSSLSVLKVSLSFSMGGSLLAIACEARCSNASNVTVWDIGGRAVIAAFKVNSNIRRLTLSPDGSKVFAEIDNGGFRFFDVYTGNAIQQTGRHDLSWIPNFNGIPISFERGHSSHLMGWFSERYERIPLLHFPTEVGISRVTVGPSILVVECEDGRILLVRP